MPVFNLLCGACGATSRKICSTLEVRGVLFPCPKCGLLELRRNASGPTTAVKETLDNGSMPKAVERYSEAERLYKERAGK